MRLTDEQRDLYSELVVQITLLMTGDNFVRAFVGYVPTHGASFDIKDRLIGHGFMGVFESACQVLQQVGAVHPVKGDRSPEDDPDAWTACFRVKYDIQGLRAHVAHSLPDSAPSLSRTIEAFLGLTTELAGQPTVSAGRDSFTIERQFEPLFELLCRCGYAERMGERVRWTNKIAPVMRNLLLWD